MQREYNRDFDRIRELKSWCDREGKSLHILANSGCLSFCAVQTFHDNLVSHEARLDVDDCIVDDSPAFCWRHFRRPENRVDFLRNTWIRPEDVHHWEPYFSVMKLATRMHANPRRVIRAYCEERFTGNLPDLLEPGHGPVFAPYVIDNSRFPDDWFERTSRCRNRCETCDYCATVLERVLVNVEALGPVPRNPRR